MKNFQTKLKLFLIISDILSMCLALNLAYFFRNTYPFGLFLSNIQPFEIYLKVSPIALLLLLLTFFFHSLYDPFQRINTYLYLLQLIKALTIWLLLIMSASYLIKYDFSRILVLTTFLLTFLFTVFLRSLLKLYETKSIKKGKYSINILIIGANRQARDLARRIKNLYSLGYKVIGFVDNTAKTKKNFPIIGPLKKTKFLIKKKNIKELFIADPSLSYDHIMELSAQCSGLPLNIRITSNIFNLLSQINTWQNPLSYPSLNLNRAQNSWWSKKPKTIFDLILSLILLTLLLPALIFISLLILLFDQNTPLFTQERIGKNGKLFKIYKFQTLYDNKPTKLGKFLRETSLDELPQLINILKGEMSLVGPRPELPQKTKNYKKWQTMRTLVKPGLTGLWQILGRKDLPLKDNLEYDFYYISNLSLKLDLEIIIKTIPALITKKGAY